jgi:hypothetical protein
VGSIAKDCATAAGVLRIVLEAEAREAQLEYEPVAPAPVMPRARIASNGHGPDVAPAPGATLTTNGAGELPGQGVALGPPLHMAERRIDLHEGDQ